MSCLILLALTVFLIASGFGGFWLVYLRPGPDPSWYQQFEDQIKAHLEDVPLSAATQYGNVVAAVNGTVGLNLTGNAALPSLWKAPRGQKNVTVWGAVKLSEKCMPRGSFNPSYWCGDRSKVASRQVAGTIELFPTDVFLQFMFSIEETIKMSMWAPPTVMSYSNARMGYPKALYSKEDSDFYFISTSIDRRGPNASHCEAYFTLGNEFVLQMPDKMLNKAAYEKFVKNRINIGRQNHEEMPAGDVNRDRAPTGWSLIVLSTLAIIACSICLCSIFLQEDMKNAFGYFTTSYALANVGIVMVIGMYSSVMILQDPVSAYDYRSTVYVGQSLTLFEFASLFSYLGQGLNRVIAVFFPLQYKHYFTKQRLPCYLGIVWAAAVALSCLHLLPDCEQYFEPLNFAFSIVNARCGEMLKHLGLYVPKLVIRGVCIVLDLVCLVKLTLMAKKSPSGGGKALANRRRDAWFLFQATANTLVQAPVLIMNELLDYYNSQYPIRLIYWIQTTCSKSVANSIDIFIMTIFTCLTTWFANRKVADRASLVYRIFNRSNNSHPRLAGQRVYRISSGSHYGSSGRSTSAGPSSQKYLEPRGRASSAAAFR